ncbi:protein NDUFAF4 homolog [Pseudomyrmex gracilis]|uniref:protein NDUFAF4 homolog n=1 Tax=Pseudomyrmex gracilis TaxID=219809 RepID=UPI000995D9D8|nr:protein NDUFAF4 homolog [Pseudomyrmex gracilis]
MGKIYSTLTRPVRTFNIENRAEKIISREKPIPAPQYESTEKQKKLLNEINPKFLEDHYKKNVQLDQRLKDVFVTSTDSQESLSKEEREIKSLPQMRHSRDDFIFDCYETAVVPEGKCTVKQAYTFLSLHKRDPTTYNSEHIAAKYKLDKKTVDEILKYFKLYALVESNSELEEPEDPFQDMIDDAIKNQKKASIEDKN